MPENPSKAEVRDAATLEGVFKSARTAHRLGAGAVVGLVAVQAIIAGQHLFGEWGIGVHAMLGNVVFGIALGTAAVPAVKRWDRSLVVIGILVVTLLTAQIAFGYASRDTESAAAIHVPLGVAVFGAALYQLLASWPGLLPRTTGRTQP